MSIDIRVVEESEHQAWIDLVARAFFEHNTAGSSAYYRSISDPGRSRGAFDGTGEAPAPWEIVRAACAAPALPRPSYTIVRS